MAVSHPLRNGGDLVYACRRRASAGRCRKAGARRRPRTTSSRRVGPSATVRAEKIFIPASASSGCFPICTCRRSTDLSRPRLTSPRNIETILRTNPRSSTARSVVRKRAHSRQSRNMRLVMAPRMALWARSTPTEFGVTPSRWVVGPWTSVSPGGVIIPVALGSLLPPQRPFVHDASVSNQDGSGHAKPLTRSFVGWPTKSTEPERRAPRESAKNPR